VGDQIGYLRLRVARAAEGVNGGSVKIGEEAVTLQLLLSNLAARPDRKAAAIPHGRFGVLRIPIPPVYDIGD
jgi:hypothetical protein